MLGDDKRAESEESLSLSFEGAFLFVVWFLAFSGIFIGPDMMCEMYLLPLNVAGRGLHAAC